MTRQFVGETPADALQSFIDEHCRATEREMETYSYQDRSVEAIVADDEAGDFTFSFTRREGSRRVVYREYEGSIYETETGEYVIDHWETAVQSETCFSRPPGQTPQRLRGRRPRDRTH